MKTWELLLCGGPADRKVYEHRGTTARGQVRAPMPGDVFTPPRSWVPEPIGAPVVYEVREGGVAYWLEVGERLYSEKIARPWW